MITLRNAANSILGITVDETTKEITTEGNLNSPSINTGQGDNEVYEMDQGVKTTDSPEFAGLTIDGQNLSSYVLKSTIISTTSPLTGGGDLTTNRTFAIPAATATVDGYATSTQITKLDGIANSANNYSLPVASTILGGVKSGTDITVDESGNVSVVDDSHAHVISNVDGLQSALDAKATPANISTAISNLVDSSPETLDTLNELAAALGDDPNFATTVSTSIGTKLAKTSNLSDLSNAATARTNLGVDPAGTDNSTDVTLNASAITGGISLSGQEISNRAATTTQSGYATSSQITAIEANTSKTSFDITSSTRLANTSGTNTGDQNASTISVTDANDYYTGSNVESVFSEIGETRNINGYDLTDNDSLPDLAFNNTTRTFSVSVKSGQSSFHFWVDNKKVIKTTTQSVVISITTGTYYIVFDTTGTLVSVAQDAVANDDFYRHAITGLVYWNATAGVGLVGNEMHGILMDPRTHHYNHSTIGARYESGLNINGLVDNTTTYTETTSGFFWDEDIRHTVALQSTHPFIYKLGSGGEWTSTTPDNNVGFENGTGDTVFNEYVGGVWQLTQSGSSTDYIIYFFIATPDISGFPIKKIIGQNGYKDRNAARNAIESEISNITTEGLPSPEFIFLYAYIVRRNGTLEDLEDDSTYVDLRVVKGTGGISGSSNVAADINTDITNFNNNLSSTDVTVQAVLDTIDNIPIISSTNATDLTDGGSTILHSHDIDGGTF